MQQTYLPTNQSKAAARFFENSCNENWRGVYPDSTTAMASPDGTVLQFDANGRISAIISPCGRELKTFSYGSKGVLLSFTNQGYRLSKVGEQWTDGVQLFDLEVAVDDLAAVTVMDKACGVVTTLFPDGGFIIAVSTELSSQYAVHHSTTNSNPVVQVDYPNGSKRCFHYDNSAELTMIEEPDGYWHKADGIWLHFNSLGGRDGLKANSIKVDFNGNLFFDYCNGTAMVLTASGERTYAFSQALAA